MSELDRIIACAGRWQGTNWLFVSPQDPADESATTLLVTPVLRGSFVRIDQTWARNGKPQEGSLVLGYDAESKQVTAHWIDTFHMGPKAMACVGEAKGDGVIDVRGGYAAPPGPDWGWRIRIAGDARAQLEIRMFNIDPAGKEALAVHATYTAA